MNKKIIHMKTITGKGEKVLQSLNKRIVMQGTREEARRMTNKKRGGTGC